jgi:hypothetical protein
MAIEYPDIVCEYIEARERYESDGVQIVPSLEPAQIPVGGYSVLIVLFQSALDVATEVVIKPELPTVGRLKAEPLVEIVEPELHVRLAPAQVGTLYVPVKATAKAREGQYEMWLNVAVKTASRANRVRSPRRTGGFQSELLDDVVGLDVGRVLGVPYTVTPTRRISVPFAVVGHAEGAQKPPSTSSKFESLWTIEDAQLQTNACNDLNARRAGILEGLAPEPVYTALFMEGQDRCSKSGSPLRVGEAIAFGKILTFCALHFLGSSSQQDGLLVPMWELALKYDLPTEDPLWVLRHVGFGHLARLSVAVSFGLVARALNSQPWDVEERRALIQEIPDRLDRGDSLPTELIYVPMLAASTTIASRITVPGEDVRQSLNLLRAAKTARADVFSDPDLTQSSTVFDQLLDAALRQLSA